MKKLKVYAALALSAAGLAGCGTPAGDAVIGTGQPAGPTPPAMVRSAAEIPKGQSSYHWQAILYPGSEEGFDPNPTLTKQEYNILRQHDWYCAKKTNDIRGKGGEMLKQGLVYGGMEGILGTMGTVIGFGSQVHPAAYLAQIGLNAFGGGMGSGMISFDQTLNVAHGYCMAMMVYKASVLEHKMRRVVIVPLYTGSALLPAASDRPEPNFHKKVPIGKAAQVADTDEEEQAPPMP